MITSITFDNETEYHRVIALLKSEGFKVSTDDLYCETSVVRVYGVEKKYNSFHDWSPSLDRFDERRITAQQFLKENMKLQPFTVYVGADVQLKDLVLKLAEQAGYATGLAGMRKAIAVAFRFEQKESGFIYGAVTPDRYPKWSYPHFDATKNLRGLIEFLPETPRPVHVKLNADYTAVIHNGVVKVGCQEFSADVIKEVARHL